MGGKTTSTTATKLDGISIQSSVLGLALPIGWGTARLSCNLIWYGGFVAIPHTTTTKAGKGLGGSSKNTTYTYTASIILGLADGPVSAVTAVYKDKAVYTGADAMAQAGLSLATGGLDQPVWPYLVSKFPGQALAYSGIAYAYAADYDLGDSAALPNHGFEVQHPTRLAGLADADPRDIVTDFLVNPQHGVPGWGAGLIGDLSSYSAYCRATGLLLSPVVDSQRQASDLLTEVTAATNSDPFWSEGVLKITPRGDAPASGNGATYTPDLTPIYDLTEDDFSPADGDPPVVLAIQDQSDAYNLVQVEFLDRANQYNTAIQSSQDLDNIITYGRRKQDPTTWHSICDAGVAAIAADLLCRRTLYLRRQFTFRLPWDFCLLEPTDKVTLTTTTDGLRLDRQLVKLLSIDEDEDGMLSCTAEELLVGTATAAAYPGHSGDGYQGNADVAPGPVNAPVLALAPMGLVNSDPEVLIAAASLSPTWGGAQVWVSVDGTSYSMAGQIDAPARYGTLTAALPTHADPDTDDTLAIDLSPSLGTLLGGTDAEMNAGATLALVGDELVSYRDAMLTGANRYSLSPLRRGLDGTRIAAHAAGDRFVRIDDAVFRLPYGSLAVGSTLYVKLASFNIFGRAVEELDQVVAHTVALTQAPIQYATTADLDEVSGSVDDPTSGLAAAHESIAALQKRMDDAGIPD